MTRLQKNIIPRYFNVFPSFNCLSIKRYDEKAYFFTYAIIYRAPQDNVRSRPAGCIVASSSVYMFNNNGDPYKF